MTQKEYNDCLHQMEAIRKNQVMLLNSLNEIIPESMHSKFIEWTNRTGELSDMFDNYYFNQCQKNNSKDREVTIIR